MADWARKIIGEVEKMEAIYRSVGDLARPGAPLDASADLDQVLQCAREHCCGRYPRLEVNLSCMPDCRVLLPAADLQQVIQEILLNSAEGRSGHEGPVTVDLSWQMVGDRLALRVADNGPGLDPVISRQAMDPFVTTKSGHVGIGLTRVETILDLHGIEWALHSESGVGVSIVMEIAEPGTGLLADSHPEEGT